MRDKLQRGFCIFLSCLIVVSLVVVPVGATGATGAPSGGFGATLLAWVGEQGIDLITSAIQDEIQRRELSSNKYVLPASFLELGPNFMTQVSEDYLHQLAFEWNRDFYDLVKFSVDVVDYTLPTGEVYKVIAIRQGYVIQRLPIQSYLGDGIGRVLYADVSSGTSGRWCSPDDTTGRQMLDYDTFWNLKEEVGGSIREVDGGVFWEIYRYDGSVYCNPAGRRFSFNYGNSNLAINANRPTTGGTVTQNNTTQNVTNTNQDIDIENMTQVLDGGTLNQIDNLIFDDNTKTYYIDSHDTTTNATNHYQYQFHVSYTSITYIGATEEYTKEYKLYYELPDGRDSADLTAEEIEQLNVNIDVIPYDRSTDNIDVRSLYHFDGDTRDSSYWNNETSFDWQSGASLTYLESNAFEGSLYLDENPHAFQLTLPRSGDAALDWTLQFRYYQTHTLTPSRDSYVDVGGRVVLWMDGSRFYYCDSGSYDPAVLTVIPTGTWNEICILRFDGRLYYYVNGVCYGSSVDSFKHSNTISFLFGTSQQTTKQIDELRFSRGALYTPGENYTPTSVPHDSNLTLVLPEGSEVIVDEVVRITSSENLLTPSGRDDWSKTGIFNKLERSSTPFNPISNYVSSSYTSVLTGYPFVYDPDYVKAYTSSDKSFEGRRVVFGGTDFDVSANGFWQPKNAIFLPLFWLYSDDEGDYWFNRSGLVGDWKKDTVYTFSVICEDGLYSSITFKIVPDSSRVWELVVLSESINSDIQFVTNKTYGPSDYEYEFYGISWNSTTGEALVRYTELVEDSEPQFEVSYENAVYVKEALQDPPILAVRTDVTITAYQIGGVRPSVPEKGQVWALVESGYISSLQVYNGNVWLSCDGRIWTGERWIPASSYNVITLQDMYDIVDSTQDYEYIYTESGFWDWLQKAWKDMLAKFDAIIVLLDPEKTASGDCQHVYDSAVEREASCSEHGRELYTCTLCGNTVTGLTDPLGHSWPVDPHSLSIYKQPQSVIAPVNTTVTFTVVAIGHGLQYQWSYLGADGVWYKSPAQGNQTSTLSIPVTSHRDGYSYRCKVTDSAGNSVFTNEAILSVGTVYESVPDEDLVDLVCSHCGVNGAVHDGEIVSSDGVPGDVFNTGDITHATFDGVFSIVTGVISTGFNGLVGFVADFSHISDFFAAFRPVGDPVGVLGIYNYGGADVWD